VDSGLSQLSKRRRILDASSLDTSYFPPSIPMERGSELLLKRPGYRSGNIDSFENVERGCSMHFC